MLFSSYSNSKNLLQFNSTLKTAKSWVSTANRLPAIPDDNLGRAAGDGNCRIGADCLVLRGPVDAKTRAADKGFGNNLFFLIFRM